MTTHYAHCPSCKYVASGVSRDAVEAALSAHVAAAMDGSVEQSVEAQEHCALDETYGSWRDAFSERIRFRSVTANGWPSSWNARTLVAGNDVRCWSGKLGRR